MTVLDGAERMQDLTEQILTEIDSAVAQRDMGKAGELLEILVEVEEGAPLLHALTAYATSLELRRERAVRWLREAQKNATQGLTEPRRENPCVS